MQSFIFVFANEDGKLVELDVNIDGGLLQALEYAQKEVAPSAKNGDVFVTAFRNGDQTGGVGNPLYVHGEA